MENYNRKPNTTCQECGKPIYRGAWRVKENNGNVFCSKICSGKRFQRKSSERPKCPVCNKIIYSKGKRDRITCSRECSNKYRAGTKYDGTQTRSKALRGKVLKSQLVELRGSCCELCKFSNVNILQVHHVVEKSIGGTDELSNLQLLCPNCHFTIHYDQGSVVESGLKRKS